MKKVKKLTQRDLIGNFIKQIVEHMSLVDTECLDARGPMRGLIELRNHLERVLYEAQNAPPLGQADGSIKPEVWAAARKLLTTLNDLEVDLNAWAEVTARR